MDIIAALRASKLIHAEEAASALAHGWVANPNGEASFSELERLYAIRYDHLLEKQGPHALQLAASVGEFLIGLRTHPGPSGQLFEIRGDAEHHFMLFVAADKVIGCLRTVSQLDVSDARWQKLWQGAA